jgi:hypothetical protein
MMHKKVKPLLLRETNDGKWEVKNYSGRWIECRTKRDAEILSNAPVIEALWLETRSKNKALADRLENTAKKMEQYNMRTTARFFRKWAKLARGEKC